MVRMVKGKWGKGLTFGNMPVCSYGAGKIIHFGSYVYMVKNTPVLKCVTVTVVIF